MAFTLTELFYAIILFTNAIAVLSEDRFLRRGALIRNEHGD
jgi:hypothetical protein